MSDLLWLFLLAAALLTGLGLGIVIEGRLQSREIDSLKEKIRTLEAIRKS